MPATSERQRRFMGAVRSYKEDRGGGSSEVKRAARSLSIGQIRDFTRKPKRRDRRNSSRG